MALDDILKKIKDEANKKKAFMKQVADDEIKKIETETEKEIESRNAEIEEKVSAQMASVINKSKILAKMAGRSQTLYEKRELIDQVYSEAEKEMNALSAHDYKELLFKMLKSAAKIVEKGSLIVPEHKKDITKEAVEKSGADFHIKFETKDFKGGFVLMSGKTEINLSFSYLIHNVVRPATELEVAKILFQ